MKKIIILLLTLLIVFSLSACNRQEENPEPQPQPADAGKDEPAVEPADAAYTEDMFDMTFEFFDTIDFGEEGKTSAGIAEIYGLWQGELARVMDDGVIDRELCFINIYELDGKMMMDVTPKLREEDGHISETDHYIGTFERSEGNNPTFINGGMIIKFDLLLTDGSNQYILGGMEIPEINESSTLKMYR